MPPPPPLQSASTGTIRSIQFQGVSTEAESELRRRLPVHEGDTVTQADLLNLGSAVQAFDNHLDATYRIARANQYTVLVRVRPELPIAAQTAQAPATLSNQAQEEAAVNGAVTVGPAVQAQKLINGPKPVYPPSAKNARVQGTVTLDAIIGTNGTMPRLVVASSSNPLLTPAALDAVKQWTYQPTLLNGNPVPVATTISVNFTLQ